MICLLHADRKPVDIERLDQIFEKTVKFGLILITKKPIFKYQ